MSVDLSGLRRFNESLNGIKSNIRVSQKNPKIKRIIDISVDEIKKAYSGVLSVSVIVEKKENGFTIYAKDNHGENPIIAFDEFGTGFYAKGSYPGKLPTQRISFVSANKKRSTNGWVYYYDNPKTKVTHGGIKGWMTPNGVFHIGKPANATMYRACKKIIARVRSEVL